jgi:hypothetical protein
MESRWSQEEIDEIRRTFVGSKLISISPYYNNFNVQTAVELVFDDGNILYLQTLGNNIALDFDIFIKR